MSTVGTDKSARIRLESASVGLRRLPGGRLARHDAHGNAAQQVFGGRIEIVGVDRAQRGRVVDDLGEHLVGPAPGPPRRSSGAAIRAAASRRRAEERQRRRIAPRGARRCPRGVEVVQHRARKASSKSRNSATAGRSTFAGAGRVDRVARAQGSRATCAASAAFSSRRSSPRL